MGKIAVNIGQICRKNFKNYSRPNERKANEVPHYSRTLAERTGTSEWKLSVKIIFLMRTNFEILVMIVKIILAKTCHTVLII